MENNTAPFKVGDEVICVENRISTHGNVQIKKGDTYTVDGVWQCPSCRQWKIDIGFKSPTQSGCRPCFKLSDIQGPIYSAAKYFRRLERYPDATKEILEKYPIPEHSEVDILRVEETVNN